METTDAGQSLYVRSADKVSKKLIHPRSSVLMSMKSHWRTTYSDIIILVWSFERYRA